MVFVVVSSSALHHCTRGLLFDRVLACDASLRAQSVYAARAPVVEVMAAAAIAGVPPVSASSSLPIIHPAATAVLANRWSTIISSQWREEEHINHLEVRSAITAIRWALSFPHSIRRRVLLLSDSQVAVGAISKGRSSSALLRRLRTLSALLFGSGMQLTHRRHRSVPYSFSITDLLHRCARAFVLGVVLVAGTSPRSSASLSALHRSVIVH